METLPYVYTTRAEVESIYGIRAVDLRLDDDPESDDVDTTEESFLTYLCEEATDIINQYVLQRYDAVALNESSWVRRRAAWIACYLLSQRRGQAKQYVSRYNEIIFDLERIMTGTLIIPRVPTSADFSPAMSNLVIDDRYSQSKIRHERNTSTGGTEGVRNVDAIPGLDFL
jgi:phage gp36-like protein